MGSVIGAIPIHRIEDAGVDEPFPRDTAPTARPTKARFFRSRDSHRTDQSTCQGDVLRSTKSDYECAESLYALLRGGECLTRKEIVARNLLSNHDFGRARKVLVATGMLQHVHKSGYTLSIHVLGGPPEAYLRGASPVEDEFDALLSVWKIEPLKSAVGTSSRINRRFSRDEQSETCEPVSVA